MQITAKSSIKHQDDGALSSLRSAATAAALEPSQPPSLERFRQAEELRIATAVSLAESITAFATRSSRGAQRDLLPGAFRLLLVGPASGTCNRVG